MQNQPSPLILTFGVSDPVGALGIQADIATFAAHGCHALSVTTALLVADSARVEEWHEVDTGVMAEQARLVLEDMPIAAVKIGAIASIEQAAAIAEIVSDYAEVPLIVDPFLSALPDSGMSDEDIVASIRQILAPQATVLQLSQSELGRMAELWSEAGAEGSLESDVAELTARGCQYVLVTGTAGSGHKRANSLFDREDHVTTLRLAAPARPFRGRRLHALGRPGRPDGARPGRRRGPAPGPGIYLRRPAARPALRHGQTRSQPFLPLPAAGRQRESFINEH